MAEDGLTRKELSEVTNTPYYVIDYLKDLGRLPLIRGSQGPGRPIIYHPDCIKIIKEHVNKQ